RGVAPVPRLVCELDVAEEHHAVRSPVLDRVREHVRIHEQTPRLPAADAVPDAVEVAQTEHRLPRLLADAEQLELELRLDEARISRRLRGHAEAALAHALEEAVALAELVRKRGQLRRPQHVLPDRITDLAEVVTEVEHRE